MSGEIRAIIDSFIERHAGGDPMMRKIIEAYMMLNGINPHDYNAQSADNPAIMEKLEAILKEIESIAAFSLESQADANPAEHLSMERC